MILTSKGFQKIQAGTEAISEALDMAAERGLKRSDVFDALLAATAKQYGISTIVTDNSKHFEGFGMRIETLETATLSKDF